MAKISKRKWKTNGVENTAYVVDYIDLAGERHRPQFSTKKQAEAFLVEILPQLAKGTFRQSSLTMTVYDIAKNYLETLTERVATKAVSMGYLECEKRNIEKHICCRQGIGGMKLRQCTTGAIRNHNKNLRNNGVSINTTKEVTHTLGRIFKQAINEDVMVFNPASMVLFEKEDRDNPVTPPSIETFRTLLRYASGVFELEIIFSAATAVRISEQFALIWRDIDFDAAELNVTKARNRHRETKGTKTKAGTRTIPLSRDLLDRLKKHRQNSPFNKPDDLVFPDSKGGFRRRKLEKLLDRIVEAESAKGRIFSKLTWHTLRHFGISCWINAGMREKTVQTFAGHKDIQTTMNRYGHLFPSPKHHEAMDRIANEIFDGAQLAQGQYSFAFAA